MVLADFLNTNLLEPQKRKLRNEGHVEGRAEGRAEGREEGLEEGREEGRAELVDLLRPRLAEQGINLDDYLTPEEPGESDRA